MPRRPGRSGSTRLTEASGGLHELDGERLSEKRRARAYCAAASRCAPSEDACAPAPGRNEARPHASGRVGVVGESCEIREAALAAPRGPPGEDAPSFRRERLLDRETSELVPKRDPSPDASSIPGAEALVELVVERARERLDQPELGSARDDRRPPRERLVLAGAQTGRARAPHRAPWGGFPPGLPAALR